MPQVGSQNEPLHERAMFGWDDSAWRRLSLLYGYSGDKTQRVLNQNAAAGTNTLTGDAVPAGEIWRIEHISAHDANSAVTNVFLRVTVNGITTNLFVAGALAANAFAIWNGLITLSEGDTVSAVLTGVTLNDDIDLVYHATRMVINE